MLDRYGTAADCRAVGRAIDDCFHRRCIGVPETENDRMGMLVLVSYSSSGMQRTHADDLRAAQQRRIQHNMRAKDVWNSWRLADCCE